MKQPSRPAPVRKQRSRLGCLLLGNPPKAKPEEHYYRCGVCKTSYGPARSRDEARDIQIWHRSDAHRGGAPDGEKIISPEPPTTAELMEPIKTAFVRCGLALFIVAIFIYNAAYGG
ncbi:hypothetical protein [Streptomyces sp. NBC_01207]|uniref:hypothetical protein n=1 Tax=Streptomyces sp. NBC_01207 TaxID=2903772 RepID=UPI002E145E70|nr:hypothetical protein OG457_27310 [Streptomyces sp. NBC_01207]